MHICVIINKTLSLRCTVSGYLYTGNLMLTADECQLKHLHSRLGGFVAQICSAFHLSSRISLQSDHSAPGLRCDF